MTRALVVDDSHFMRTVISDIPEGGGVDVACAVTDTGVHTLAQDEETSVVFGIGERPIGTGCVDEVPPTEALTGGITDAVRRRP